jgi:hypothetical protein
MRPTGTSIAPREIDARYRTLVVMWTALLISVGMYIFFTRVAVTPSSGNLSREAVETNRMILWGCAALGVLTFLLSFLLKSKFLKQSVEKQDVRIVQTGTVVALALCEATCLFGLLAYFITSNLYAYLLFGLAVLGMLLHFPRKAHLMDAAFERQRFGM